MKAFKNSQFKEITSEKIKTIDDLILIFDSVSKKNRDLIFFFFDYQRAAEEGRLPKGIIFGISTIAKKMKKEFKCPCTEKTIDRFIRDLGGIVQHRQRIIGGKQSSNEYRMPKHIFKFLRWFWRLGLWKRGNKFSQTWNWIKKKWIDCDCDETKFMNMIYNYKSKSSKEKKGGCEQSTKKMSLGENAKCPSSLYSLSSILDEYGTGVVPLKNLKEIEVFLIQKFRHVFEDIKWFALEKGNRVRDFRGLFNNRLKVALG
jgi:hypothetical protein